MQKYTFICVPGNQNISPSTKAAFRRNHLQLIADLYIFVPNKGHTDLLPEGRMHRNVLLAAAAVMTAAGIFAGLRFRDAGFVKKAVEAEARGDHAAALAAYADALCRAVPDRAVPDFNRSKVFSPARWRRTVEKYVAWLSGVRRSESGAARQDTLLNAVARSAGRVHEDNFRSGESRNSLGPEQYEFLWNSAFFARGVAPDTAHRRLVESCYRRGLSFVKISALTSFSYEVSLIDTAAGRRTTFGVFPESSTLLLAPPGAHVLLCRSSYQPGPGMIWRSAPTVIPVTVPSSPSLCSFTLETHVVRKKDREQ
jgi:hypothetical protein